MFPHFGEGFSTKSRINLVPHSPQIGLQDFTSLLSGMWQCQLWIGELNSRVMMTFAESHCIQYPHIKTFDSFLLSLFWPNSGMTMRKELSIVISVKFMRSTCLYRKTTPFAFPFWKRSHCQQYLFSLNEIGIIIILVEMVSNHSIKLPHPRLRFYFINFKSYPLLHDWRLIFRNSIQQFEVDCSTNIMSRCSCLMNCWETA